MIVFIYGAGCFTIYILMKIWFDNFFYEMFKYTIEYNINF